MALLYAEESYIIRGAAYGIYKLFRNSHKEAVYQKSFYLALKKNGYRVEKEKRIDVYYEKEKVGIYVPDLIVNGRILIELKAKPRLLPEDIKQFWHYLKGTEYRLGFLINFGSSDGVEIERRVYDSARLVKASTRGSA
jgi:GxxExxY protein